MVEYSKLTVTEPGFETTDRMQDWRQAIQIPTAYRIGNSTVRLQYQFVMGVLAVGVIALVMFYNSVSHSKPHNPYMLEKRIPTNYESDHLHKHNLPEPKLNTYNSTYPFTTPVRTEKGVRYKIAIISDLDTNSKKNDEWISYLKTGSLFVDVENNKVSLEWDKDELVTLKTSLAQGGRGMELSELVVFNGALLGFDDRTGTIYQIDIASKFAFPWVLLVDGHGRVAKGFKSEWATVKDQTLYVGGLGKAWTTPTGELVNYHPQYIKKISPTGEVSHIDWHTRYEKLAKTVDISFPGYIIHESVSWSSVHKRWFFLPRRESKDRYDEKLDESRGTNLMLTADEEFSDIKAKRIGDISPTHGFSSFKFVPNTHDKLIVALKSEENQGKTASFIMAFDIDGQILLPETKIDGDFKYEGIEFI
ncbi:soluble calcium-activated nucleotidase 1 [Daphnia magna]|uniref:Soluble calcium-activated nucleotidase 1 n=1 Tax=Daphnia magna TaxID=35525 RepID=A0ABR0AMH9_9CRUS|nr:soluble calcium-activated nucleotidase 1 [Daphnia magna]KAK4026327.1 hypothetical protein OUZ56_015334 [Daphnia magna]